MKSGAPVSLDTLLQLFEKNWIADGYESRGHEEKRRREGREVLTRFFEVNSVPAWTVPTFLERPFSLKIGQARVTGRIDRIDQLEDGTYEVIDYKTGSSKKDTDLERDLQLSLYALACRESLGIAVSRLSLYFIDDNVKISTTRTGEQLEQCRSEILELVEEMLKSDFQPTPGFHCRFCDFRLICPVAK
jgi:DNA helicase-2/ATP-dependent DNA helicase PcrA